MIRLLSFCAVIALLAAPAYAADCNGEVLAAFEKQRTSKAFRVALEQKMPEGDVKMTIDYIPPAKMLQTVVSPAMPGEQQTMLVGDRAFAGLNGVWEELLPMYSQSVVAEVHTAVGEAPKNLGVFECLGRVRFEGKEFVGYRTKPDADAEKPAEGAVTRTIYVDAATGLPAYNVVGSGKQDDASAVKVVYSYPADVVIEAPEGAPVQKIPY